MAARAAVPRKVAAAGGGVAARLKVATADGAATRRIHPLPDQRKQQQQQLQLARHWQTCG